MNLKEQLIQLKNKLLGRKIERESYVPESTNDIKIIDLSDEEGKVVIGGKNELNISVADIVENFKKTRLQSFSCLLFPLAAWTASFE